MKLFILFSVLVIAGVVIQGKSISNGGDTYELFEGDMLLQKKEIAVAMKGGDVDAVNDPQQKGDFGYGMSKHYSRKWSMGVVPYDISAVVSGFHRAFGSRGPTESSVLNAMKEIEQKTCIRFKERTNERNYVKIIDGGHGMCYSNVGRSGGAQKLSIGFGCFYMGIAIHELLHALGMYHEQSRPDRDQYVEIVYDNIQKDMKSNFQKYSHHEINSGGSPYDFGSIMHYSWNAMATWPWLATIRSKTGASFGQRSHMSVQDALQINRAYNCPIKHNT